MSPEKVETRRYSKDHGGALLAHQCCEGRGIEGAAAQQPIATKQPEIAELADWEVPPRPRAGRRPDPRPAVTDFHFGSEVAHFGDLAAMHDAVFATSTWRPSASKTIAPAGTISDGVLRGILSSTVQ